MELASCIVQSIERCVLSAVSSPSSFLCSGVSPLYSRHLELLGVDVVLDEGYGAWLCEVNSMPDLLVSVSPQSCVFPVDLQVKRGVISDLLTLLQLPRGAGAGDDNDEDERRRVAVDSTEPPARSPHHVGGFRRLV